MTTMRRIGHLIIRYRTGCKAASLVKSASPVISRRDVFQGCVDLVGSLGNEGLGSWNTSLL